MKQTEGYWLQGPPNMLKKNEKKKEQRREKGSFCLPKAQNNMTNRAACLQIVIWFKTK